MSKAARIGIFVIVVCGLMGGVGNVLAYDGNELLEKCKPAIDGLKIPLLESDEEAYALLVEIGVCFGYVYGVNQAYEVLQHALGQEDYCPPDEALTRGQTARIIVKYLEDNPAHLHEGAVALIILAFRDAFPCPEGEQP